jgi:hypothetical protein
VLVAVAVAVAERDLAPDGWHGARRARLRGRAGTHVVCTRKRMPRDRDLAAANSGSVSPLTRG